MKMDTIVPLTPSGLCFERECFVQESFSADIFLKELQSSVSLELLRDDLGAYLKVLRAAMIELINRDYADFVNLSGNLIGLDNAISSLQQPLSYIYAEIAAVEKVLNEVHNKLQFALGERTGIREQKLTLECLMKIPTSLIHLETQLTYIQSNNTPHIISNDTNNGNRVERAANEYSQLQHLLIKSCNSTLNTTFKKRAENVRKTLLVCLEDTLFYGIENKRKDVLRKSLHTFVLLGQSKLAIELVRIRVIVPAFEGLMNQNSLKMEPHDLQGLLNRIKELVELKLDCVIEVCQSSEALQEALDFVAYALWPEFCSTMISKLDCVFAQGNPDLFHKRYTCTMEFLKYLEDKKNNSVSSSLRKDLSYCTLMARWNLPVYFQLRFQEVAGILEASLIHPFKLLKDENRPEKFESTVALLDSLKTCYSSEIFLMPLAYRFWKLSLQLLARYKNQITENLTEHQKCREVSGTIAIPTQTNIRNQGPQPLDS